MFGYLRVWLILLIASDLGFCEEYNCVHVSYLSNGEVAYSCRDECVGVAPNCLPDCYNRCPEHSRCVSPKTCECDVGYKANEIDETMVPSLKSCSKVKCPLNSRRGERNTCVCHEGYEVNTTDSNAIPSLQSCKPICKQNCPEYSYCASPNTCKCSENWEADGLQGCKPMCQQKCPLHSRCVAPNKCECDIGYESSEIRDGATQLLSCKSSCNIQCPENGFCASPHLCECRLGYNPITTQSGALESCFEDNFNGLHIAIYSLLVCFVIFVIGAVIVILTRKVSVKQVTPADHCATSWRTSFASYNIEEMQ